MPYGPRLSEYVAHIQKRHSHTHTDSRTKVELAVCEELCRQMNKLNLQAFKMRLPAFPFARLLTYPFVR